MKEFSTRQKPIGAVDNKWSPRDYDDEKLCAEMGI